jgi:hypothetical protein
MAFETRPRRDDLPTSAILIRRNIPFRGHPGLLRYHERPLFTQFSLVPRAVPELDRDKAYVAYVGRRFRLGSPRGRAILMPDQNGMSEPILSAE